MSVNLLDTLWLDGCDVGIAFEIFGVECQQVFDVVGFHGSDDFCVMDLDTGDKIFNDEFAPVFIDFRCVGQKVENPFDLCQFGIGFRDGKPKPFLSFGHVQTFQNSETFCKMMKSVSPRLSNLSTAFFASA